MAKLIILSNTKWKQPFIDRAKEYHLWPIPKEIKENCEIEDGQNRKLRISFDPELNINDIEREFHITSGKEISFPKEIQRILKSTIPHNRSSYFVAEVMPTSVGVDSAVQDLPDRTMSISNTRIHICFGELEKDYEDLKSYALLPAGEVFDWWNVTKSARPGDMVIFYITDPVSAFVASATIDSIGKCPDITSKWKDKPCAWLRDAEILPKEVTRTQVQQLFPEWRYLNRPTATCIPNESTPSELVDRFLALLEVKKSIAAEFDLETAEQPTSDTIILDERVLEIQKRGAFHMPGGVLKPPLGTVNDRKERMRDPKVKAWVKLNARGICELCQNPAPFNDDAGFPYLEVHHVHTLGDGGSDTPQNAVALCPTCHRVLHYGNGRNDAKAKVYRNVTRLVKE